MKIEHAIEEAYFNNLDTLVTADEAAELCADKQIAKNDAVFLCADELCRKIIPAPKMSCVCCFTDQCRVPRYFRNYPGNKHHENCIYAAYVKAVEEILKNVETYKKIQNLNLCLTYKDTNLNPAEIIDAYCPADDTSYMDDIRKERENNRNRGMSSQEALLEAVATIYRKTRRLEAVVYCYELLSKNDDIDIAQLTIPGRNRASYSQIFRKIHWIREHYKTPYILYGEARIYRFSKNMDGFGVFFAEAVRQYVPDEKNISATCFISQNDLSTYRYGARLREQLSGYAYRNAKCCLYILGSHALNKETDDGLTKKSNVVISPNSLADVVIRNLCVK
jgi:hypothetical protein